MGGIGLRVEEGLQIVGMPTSEQTAGQARSLGIPLSTLGEYPQIDVTIDGADEVELGTLNFIKGGGGNQLREKIVATASSRLVIAVDETKSFPTSATAPECRSKLLSSAGRQQRKIARLSATPILRLRSDGEPFVTDGGNYILDCAFGHYRIRQRAAA